MPGLIRGMARTAVVAGTATAVSNRVSRRQANRWAQQETAYGPPEPGYSQQPQYEQQYAPPPPPAPAAEPAYVAELQRLAQLRDQGIITSEDYEAKKANILGI